MMKKLSAFILMLVIPVLSYGQDIPTAEEVHKVLNFYYNGQGLGVVMSDSKVCRGIHREGDQKNDCSGEVAAAVTKGEPIYIWMAFMVPSGDEQQNIILQFEHGGVTRMVKNLTVKGSLRYRVWRKVSLDKTGQWTAKTIHDKGESTTVLGTQSITVE